MSQISDERKAKIEKVVAQRQAGFVIVLEDVHDPHNAMAVSRTCDAFGIQDVHLIFDKEPSYNPKRVGKVSSSSANKWLTFTKHSSAQECYEQLKKEGFTIVATALTDRSESIFDADLTHDKIALVLGNEHRGLSDCAIQNADTTLLIPMQGMVQSLNISVTAALGIYEIFHQRQASGQEYVLDTEAQSRLLKEFVEK